MCINCLKSKVDITQGIAKQATIFFCRGCGRYQRPPWVHCELESRELLALCLLKIKNTLKDVKLVDAGFVWTEPHSRRLKVKLTVEKEVMNGLILRQVFVVEYILANQQCPDCQKSYTEHTWNTVVQIRQKGAKHKRTLFFLEQLLLKHNVCEKALSIKEQPDGMDVYWAHKSHAMHMMAFLKSVVPIKEDSAKRLISQDEKSNIKNYKFTFIADIAPICKDDLCLLDPRLARELGGVSPLMLCHKVSSSLHLIDPVTLKFVEVSAGTYWRYPFRAIMSTPQLVDFIVLNVEKVDHALGEGFNKHGALRDKLALAEVEVAKASDMGVNDITYTVLSHLGNILKPGDTVRGYDVSNCNLSEATWKQMKDKQVPDVILVRKTYPNRKNRAARRRWKLKHLPKEREGAVKKADELREAEEYEDFLRDIEEDPELRSKINLYKRKDAAEGKGPAAMATEEDGFPDVGELADEMEQLKTDDGPDDTAPLAFGAPAAGAAAGGH